MREADRAGATRPIRVAVADDSVFIRKAVARMMEGVPSIEVVGTAASGEELLDRLESWRPDVVTLDLKMPGMGGLAALDHIMRTRPLPVIILSTFARAGAQITLEALHRGAVDFIDKSRYSLVDFATLGEVLIEKVEQVAGSSVQLETAPPPAPPRPAATPAPAVPAGRPSRFRLLMIGASTGGPVAIQRLLTDLGAELPVPALVVQHMPPGFTRAFADRLNAHLPLPVREATDGEALLAGTVYIAPAGRHLRVELRAGRLAARLDAEPGDAAHRPSADVLFESARDAVGGNVVAVLLTGMGSDGARGMKELAEAGATTVAQDRESSVVFGMPRAALAAGAVKEVLALERIGARLVELLGA